MIDRSLAQRPQHRCDPPEILSFEFPPNDAELDHWSMRTPTIHCDFPPGTRFFCEECGAVLVSTYIPGGCNGYVAWTPSYKWLPETGKQRRQRMGHPFWALWR